MRKNRFLQTYLPKAAAVLALCLALSSCQRESPSSLSGDAGDSEGSGQTTLEAPASESRAAAAPVSSQSELTVWLAYWNQQNTAGEMDALGDKMNGIVHFAAYFDASDTLFIPAKTAESFQTLKAERPDCTHYLSFVNDRLKEGGDSSLKDTELLEALLVDDSAIQKHARDILTLAQNGGYDGIEIDYENIKKNMPLWEKFARLIEKLQPMAAQAGLRLRVLFEPNAPLSELTFPDGPEYVMMCYNLFGSHGTPGPKADTSFIQELEEQMQTLPGEKAFAFATGGFDWAGKGDAAQLTELDAKALEARATTKITRDADSGAITFNYRDDTGKTREVWYADGETLCTWIRTLREAGNYSVSLWRLSGNDTASLEKVAGMF